MGNLKRYLDVLEQIRIERGERCEGCRKHAVHGHHIIRVGDTSIHSELVFEPANIMILCDECHALMHPLIRNVNDWKIVRKDRGRMLRRPI